MKFIKRLASGDVALWFAFWLIGTPLALIFDSSGLCMLTECGIGKPYLAIFIIVLFAASCIAIVFVSFAIWRSSTNYPRAAWWQTVLAILAKLSAVFSALIATLSLVGVLYLAFTFLYAAVAL
ncbi:MAG TPA: hypothetical protein VH206_04765 [Xanthobacteraceae bacterium]|jgi:hypothetical protein|nr:hypothetical protein [Xanthobacteraceae bacterium]